MDKYPKYYIPSGEKPNCNIRLIKAISNVQFLITFNNGSMCDVTVDGNHPQILDLYDAKEILEQEAALLL